jgi:hypothetical protein
MRIAKSFGLVSCRFVAKPSPFPGGLRGNRSKQTSQVGHNENCWQEVGRRSRGHQGCCRDARLRGIEGAFSGILHTEDHMKYTGKEISGTTHLSPQAA